jgi:hypothetical protein
VPWSGDVESFVEATARARDVQAFRGELESVPPDHWPAVRARLAAHLDQVVPGEPESPPLTHGEGRGPRVLSQDELRRQAADLEEKRRALAEAAERRG